MAERAARREKLARGARASSRIEDLVALDGHDARPARVREARARRTSTRRGSRSTRSRRCCRRSKDTPSADVLRDFQQVLANMRLAYADALRQRARRSRAGGRGDRRPRREDAVTQAEIGVFGGSGFYSFLDDVEEVDGRDAVRAAVGAGHDRRHRRQARRVPAAARARARAAARADQLPRERLGDEGARRPPDHRPERVRRAEGRARARRVRRLRPVRRPDARARGHVLRGPGDDARLAPPTRSAPTCGASSSRPRASSASRCATAAPSSSSRARASRRAPSRAGSRTPGWDTINMTAYPEGYLARELELCYANISMVTDHDVGVEGAPPVSHHDVLARLRREQRAAARAPLRRDPEDRPAAGGRLLDRARGARV